MKKILLVNWDCYPNVASGGVYTWTKNIIDTMTDWEFIVVNQISNPLCNGKYTLPKHVTKVIEIPIFGSNRYEEYYHENKSLLGKIIRTSDRIVKKEFLPLYKEFIDLVLSSYADPRELSEVIFKLHKFLTKHDTKKCFENYKCWQIFWEKILADPLYRHMTLKEAHMAFQLIERNLQVLSLDMPKVDIIHCSLAWLPSFIAIFTKMEQNCPVIITEHGVAFRELLLYYNGVMNNEASKIFWTVFSRNIVKTVYWVADLVTPVCTANAVWEQDFQTEKSKIKVIYNGVNTDKFKPMQEEKTQKNPTVVYVGRLEIFKDMICLIQSVKYVKEKIPDVKCLIYGGSMNLEYSIRCVGAVKNFGLEDTIKFMGPTKEPHKAYNEADVVAIASVIEGFPFTIIEAMACGKAVVASDVGGVREALQGCGILAKSRHPKEFAENIVKLLKDKNLRDEMGAAAIKRVLKDFTLPGTVADIKETYESLLLQKKQTQEPMGSVVQ